MRLSSLTVAAGLTAVLYAGIAYAQQNLAIEREDLMKGNIRGAILLTKMTKGEVPYDAAKVNAAFDQWAETAKKMPSLFPDSAKEGGDNRALPTVWTNRGEFDRQIGIFAKDVQEQRTAATSGLDGLKAVMAVVGKDCDNCHDQFRRPSR
jgi:cytochrome c556